MSKVFSFRLNISNPREEQAIMLLEDFQKRGYSIRYIITQALIRFEDFNFVDDNISFEELSKLLGQFKQLEEQLCACCKHQMVTQDDSKDISPITKPFIDSIKKSAKVGIKVK